MAWRLNSKVDAPMRGWMLIRASSSRFASTARSSACREDRARSALAWPVSVTVTTEVALSNPSFSPTTT